MIVAFCILLCIGIIIFLTGLIVPFYTMRESHFSISLFSSIPFIIAIGLLGINNKDLPQERKHFQTLEVKTTHYVNQDGDTVTIYEIKR